jgi:signal transduction histidine kinase/CheY-like chemotaxis protein/HPt (histidine-containing phosphotransfer) domain-containing protein
MRALRAISIRQKLTLIILLTSAVAVAVACVVFATYDGIRFKRAMVNQLSLQAEIIGANSTAAILFNDERAAQETLGALAADDRIVSAQIYTEDGRRFAEYVRHGVAPGTPPPVLPNETYRFTHDRLEMRRPIVLRQETVGTVYLRSDLRAMRERFNQYAGIILVVILASGLVAFSLSARLQRMISDPIGHLAQTAAAVSTGHDYSLRVEKHSADEIGLLIDGFNRMLTQIEERDGALKRAHDELEVRVDQRTAELQEEVAERRRTQMELEKARDLAESATRAKSEFLANMSHEIRTPMNAVVGMTGLLLNTSLTPEQQEYVDTIKTGGDTLLTIINDILDFSKIESGKLELENRPFSLSDCVEKALDLLAPGAAEKGLNLAYLIEDETPEALRGDASRLGQILVNLLSNAVKFTSRGEIVVSVKAQRLAEARHELHFAVRDTGIGIPRDRMDRLFHSFSQVDASTTRRYGGTGLGLAISKRLAELMGGRMWVESEVGRGTTFYFTIVGEAAPSQAQPYLRGASERLTGKRLLVADDNATNRRILTLQAESWGMLPNAVASAADALDLIRQGEVFDLAILDLQMPDTDGVALAAAIRHHPGCESMPLVMLTSVGWRNVDSEAVQLAAILTKPIKPSQLYEALTAALGSPQTAAASPIHRPSNDARMGEEMPLRILLAEDNVVNQKVASRILQLFGYSADLATNGLEVLEALERRSYDVVFMDVQMPDMDGLEASRRICQRWPEAERPRIVAMTANAMQGDRDLCLAAGMDDYIAKPVEVRSLRAALERAASHRLSPAKQRTPETHEPIDWNVLAGLRELQQEGEPDIIRKLFDLFAADTPLRLAAIREAVENRNAAVLARQAHALKGSSAHLGARHMATLSATLQQIGEAGSLEAAASTLSQLETEFERVTQVFEAEPQETENDT